VPGVEMEVEDEQEEKRLGGQLVIINSYSFHKIHLSGVFSGLYKYNTCHINTI
jgi:hypothetical protein